MSFPDPIMNALSHFLLVLPLLLAGCGSDDSSTHRFSGTMEATTIRVSAQTSGLVTSRPVEEGDTVSAGSLLATIETRKLDLQADQGSAQLRELDFQIAALDRQIAAQRSTLALWDSRVQRYAALRASQAISTQTLDDATAQRDALREQLRSLDANRAALQSRKAQVGSGIAMTRTSITDASVPSPISGTVLVTYAERGEYALPGTPICDVADLTSMWTMIYIEEPLLGAVRLGQRAEVLVDGLSSPLEGVVRWVSPRAEFTPKTILTEDTRTSLVYAVKIAVRNPEGRLKIGMPVTVRIAVR